MTRAWGFALVPFSVVLAGVIASAQITVTEFQPGTPILADEVQRQPH